MMTLEEALDLIPTHIYLKPGKDKWQEGDEFWSKNHTGWWAIAPDRIGAIVGSAHWSHDAVIENDLTARRSMPEAVRQDMALDLKLSMEEATTSEFQERILGTRKIT
jgi:hypothetical protein